MANLLIHFERLTPYMKDEISLGFDGINGDQVWIEPVYVRDKIGKADRISKLRQS